MHPDGVGSIALGENNTVGTEAVIVETGGGNDKLQTRKTSLDRGRTLHRDFSFFAAGTTDKSCDLAAGGV